MLSIVKSAEKTFFTKLIKTGSVYTKKNLFPTTKTPFNLVAVQRPNTLISRAIGMGTTQRFFTSEQKKRQNNQMKNQKIKSLLQTTGTLIQQGKLEQSLKNLNEALALTRETGEDNLRHSVLNTLISVYASLSNQNSLVVPLLHEILALDDKLKKKIDYLKHEQHLIAILIREGKKPEAHSVLTDLTRRAEEINLKDDKKGNKSKYESKILGQQQRAQSPESFVKKLRYSLPTLWWNFGDYETVKRVLELAYPKGEVIPVSELNEMSTTLHKSNADLAKMLNLFDLSFRIRFLILNSLFSTDLSDHKNLDAYVYSTVELITLIFSITENGQDIRNLSKETLYNISYNKLKKRIQAVYRKTKTIKHANSTRLQLQMALNALHLISLQKEQKSHLAEAEKWFNIVLKLLTEEKSVDLIKKSIETEKLVFQKNLEMKKKMEEEYKKLQNKNKKTKDGKVDEKELEKEKREQLLKEQYEKQIEENLKSFDSDLQINTFKLNTKMTIGNIFINGGEKEKGKKLLTEFIENTQNFPEIAKSLPMGMQCYKLSKLFLSDQDIENAKKFAQKGVEYTETEGKSVTGSKRKRIYLLSQFYYLLSYLSHISDEEEERYTLLTDTIDSIDEIIQDLQNEISTQEELIQNIISENKLKSQVTLNDALKVDPQLHNELTIINDYKFKMLSELANASIFSNKLEAAEGIALEQLDIAKLLKKDDKSPRIKSVLYFLAIIRIQKNNLDAAIDTLNEFFETKEDHPFMDWNGHLLFAQVTTNLGKYEEARKHFKIVKERWLELPEKTQMQYLQNFKKSYLSSVLSCDKPEQITEQIEKWEKLVNK
ncbi:response regulator aspartate phosphatase g [Anaeramoeba flamelloides]|uniref:Response regulator aspartate phosphatase g n=1 Tax=Anaeramoeba flamelloides TaxID=1746091 RepID=A0AAV8A235_9EUKA|nr:response regulator aspartate phosphatase g [Anaeramoeba flamelloides]